MVGLRFAAVIVLVVLIMGLVGNSADAANVQGRQVLIETRLTVYSSTFTARQLGFEFGRHDSTMLGAELRISYPTSRWGFGGEFLTGGQRSGSGAWTNLQSGTDKIVGGWLTYNVIPPTSMTRLDLMAGYGKNKWDTTFSGGSREVFRAQGLLLGFQLHALLATNFVFGARALWIPSANTSLERGGVTTTATGSAIDYLLYLTYLSGPWGLTAGYRAKKDRAGNLSGCTDCEFEWRGPYVQFQYTF
ncbi:MAG: hypothetical protein ACT4P5_18615 [Armatimonadota bacterium]